ncbi:enolase C-terminal domain-like protein [Paenibacillus yanchengensis]|uniref:Enolase C-terminal domain-like protein n=1 Tax=Paenibacillus yanchengensis TaxID=2035833 RepID=A0ABW4YIW3_9BACL
MKQTDMTINGVSLYELPIETRVPLKFGAEILTTVTCARVSVQVTNRDGKDGIGWGETPLSVQWVWPSSLSYHVREQALKQFCQWIAKDLVTWTDAGHSFEIGFTYQQERLFQLLDQFNKGEQLPEPIPHLAALVCFSPFDIALHDAFGIVNEVPIYETYNSNYMNADLSTYLQPAAGTNVDFTALYPEHFLQTAPSKQLLAWHLVGGKDLLYRHEWDATNDDDGYPYTLEDWIERDGLQCLKVKLTGNDADWDYDRLVQVGNISLESNVTWLTADFNCQVTDCAYVNDIFDQLMMEHPRIYQMILYIEQPFPYDLEQNQLDVRSVSARKPLFMDESAHDWHLVKLGRELGWTGVALKTCKTQTGALLSLCWAKAHGMTLMVQDLTNPMLAQIPHLLLAYYAGTIMGVETNGMQFYPAASHYEAVIHPGLYDRKNGKIDLQTLDGYGFGYRVEEINRPLSQPVVTFIHPT